MQKKLDKTIKPVSPDRIPLEVFFFCWEKVFSANIDNIVDFVFLAKNSSRSGTFNFHCSC